MGLLISKAAYSFRKSGGLRGGIPKGQENVLMGINDDGFHAQG